MTDISLQFNIEVPGYFQNTLTQTQDRAFRRISELKEQIQLDQLAKKDLEENYRLMLEEKDEHIKVFRTQVEHIKMIEVFRPQVKQEHIEVFRTQVKHYPLRCSEHR